jgi:hypothetical protein
MLAMTPLNGIGHHDARGEQCRLNSPNLATRLLKRADKMGPLIPRTPDLPDATGNPFRRCPSLFCLDLTFPSGVRLIHIPLQAYRAKRLNVGNRTL